MTELFLYDRMALRSIVERNAICIVRQNMDKELAVLTELGQSPKASQRMLAYKTGLSLGTVNILINKMVREGLVKLEKMPSDRIAYMVTARGIEEKFKKTRYYIEAHYKAIECMRTQLKKLFESDGYKSSRFVIMIEQPELRALVGQVLVEAGHEILDSELGETVEAVVLTDGSRNGLGSSIVVNVLDYIHLT